MRNLDRRHLARHRRFDLAVVDAVGGARAARFCSNEESFALVENYCAAAGLLDRNESVEPIRGKTRRLDFVRADGEGDFLAGRSIQPEAEILTPNLTGPHESQLLPASS